MGQRTERSASWVDYDDHGNTTGDGYVTYSTTSDNNGREPRSTTSYINGTSDSCTVNIRQSGRPLYVNLEGGRSSRSQDATYSIGSGGGTIPIHGKTNAKTLSFAIGTGAFITLDSYGYQQRINGTASGIYIQDGEGPTGDPGANGEWEFQMEVVVAANADPSARTATVVVTGYDDDNYETTATATIVQDAAEGYVQINDAPTGTFGNEVTLTFNWNDNNGKNVYVHSNEQWSVSLE